ncbi:DNA (cytosine-5-)-methyltransferase [Anaerocolumna sedimenticola]|uniref:Cytosine-specific methyltransferase n=2 Tax=Anaerocolumna sedimenticola TaxID=2696063 RepID=A0A6P1TWQ3_9FIRM|nr:DNA (cytosine-5-)-methyltransferase [Anaerocolumna sedimenticola]
MDKDAINTLTTRTAYHYLKQCEKIDCYIQYLKKEISRNDLYSTLPLELMSTIFNETISYESLNRVCDIIDNNMSAMNCTEVDGLIGGPPCQTYSIISRSNGKYQNEKDQRNHLYKLYAEILAKYSPKFFVFENVPGIKTIKNGDLFRELLSLIESKGYTVFPLELNAMDFGVLQNRTRVIITGWKKEYNIKEMSYPISKNSQYIVNDALLDLYPLKPGEEINRYYSSPNNYLLNSGIRSNLEIPLTQHMCRYHNENDREIYKIAIDLWNTEKKRLVYSQLPSRLITRSNPDIFSDKYKVVAGDLPYSHTIIAHISKDGHYYIHPDIKQARSISVREAARIQSFPDDYFFEGTRQKVYTQIGNAVPPLMAKKIAQGIKEVLKNVQKRL